MFRPYNITHLYLDKPWTELPLPTAEAGQYLVYWWGDVPLGQSFFEAGERMEPIQAMEAMVTAIAPAVAHYTATRDVAWDQWIKAGQLTQFCQWLGKEIKLQERQALPEPAPLSVVICTRNRAPQLKQCLQSLSLQVTQPQQVVVVDNAPSDNSSAEVAAQFPWVTYVREPRAGLNIARNTGALAATCPIVAYTDDDVHLHQLWVGRIWEAFEQRTSMAALTGLVIATELQTEAQLIFEKFWSFNRGYTDKVYDRRYFENNLQKGPPVWDIGAGANMAFRKSVFEAAGYFDELLDAGKAGCNGDSELWFRILDKGLEIHYNPRVVAFHEHRRSMNELQRQLFHYSRGFTVAALLQQQRQPAAGYHRHLFYDIPIYQLRQLKRGFPHYRFQYGTVGTELKGFVAGLWYYLKHKKESTTIPYNAPQRN